MIDLVGIEKNFGPERVLDSVSLSVPQGSVFGLLGPNGAGKTTLLSILFGLIPKDAGSVSVDGKDLDKGAGAMRAGMALVPQHLAFYPMLSARENLEFFASALGLYGAERAERIAYCVEAAGLEKFYLRRSEHYSGGLQRRLNLAIGLLNRPRVLCLDEPTVGIDPQSRSFILDKLVELNRDGMTVLYTSHYMEEVEQICTDIAVIDHGRILVCDSKENLLHQTGPAALELTLDPPAGDTSLTGMLQAFPSAHLEAGRIRFDDVDATELLSRLLPQLSRDGFRISGLRYGRHSLEELFLNLTNKALRD